jgi:peptidyl-tRNA hydrolase, PTH1 family
VTAYVLGDFAKADAEWLDPLLEAVADASPALAAGDTSGFASRVGAALPAREKPKKAQKAEAPKPAATAAQEPRPALASDDEPESEPEARSALQRLIDRFR